MHLTQESQLGVFFNPEYTRLGRFGSKKGIEAQTKPIMESSTRDEI